MEIVFWIVVGLVVLGLIAWGATALARKRETAQALKSPQSTPVTTGDFYDDVETLDTPVPAENADPVRAAKVGTADDTEPKSVAVGARIVRKDDYFRPQDSRSTQTDTAAWLALYAATTAPAPTESKKDDDAPVTDSAITTEHHSAPSSYDTGSHSSHSHSTYDSGSSSSYDSGSSSSGGFDSGSS